MAALLPSKRRSIAKQLRGSLLIALLLATPSFLGGSPAIAANGTWSGGAGATWDASTTNWLNLTGIPWDVTNGGTNTAVFNTAGATPTVSGTVWANGITFANTATISNGTINLAGATPTITTTASGTISSILDGSSGLTKAGAGTLVLSGSNSFSGGVTLTGGQLQINNANALGTGTFTTNVDAATTIPFSLPTSGTVANAITITRPGVNRAYTFQQNQTNNLTLAGNITVASGNTNRFQLAAGVSSGTFTLTGSNSFGADVATGANITFRFSGTNAAGGTVWRPDATTNFVLLDGAVFRSTIGNSIASYGMETSGTASVTGDVFGAGPYAINTPAGAQLSFTAVVRTSPTINKTGDGTFIMTSAFNSPMTLNVLGGTVQVPLFAALSGSTEASYLVLNGGTLRYTGAAASTAKQFTLGANGGSLDASGSGAANFTSGSAVAFAGSGNRTLTLTGTNTGANALAAALNDNGVDRVSLAKTGTGAWALSGSNAYSGGTTLSAGQLAINNASAIGTGTFTISSGTLDNSTGAAVTLATNNPQAWNGNFGFVGSSPLNLGTGAVTLGASRQVTVTSSTLTVGGGIGDGGSAFALTKAGAGTLVLSGSNAFSGGVTLTGGQVQIANANALGTGVFTTNVDADTTIPFNLPTSGTVANAITITRPGVARTYTFQQNQAGNVTLAGNITVASGNGNRFQLATGVSSGTFTLTGSNSFGGDVGTGANVTFRFSGTNAAGGNVWRPDATTKFLLLDGASFRTTIGNAIASYGMEASGTASVTGDVNASSASTIAITTAAGAQLSFTGVVRGGATYNKTGAGTWVVSSQFNDPITANILEGTVQVPVFSALGGSSGASYLVLNGGALRYTGAAASTAKQFTLGANGGSLDASGSGSAAFTSTAAVAFTGSGNRTLTLTGTNTGANTLAAALNDNGADVISLTKAGGGTWVLSGSNGYTGVTNISAGVLALGTSSALAGGGMLTFGGGTLQFSSANTQDYASRIRNSGNAVSIDTNNQSVTFANSLDSTNTGGLTKAGAGTLVLAGSNSFSGGVTLTGGQVQIANANALGTGVFTTNVDADTTIPFNLPTSGTVANAITITRPGVARTYVLQQNQAGNVTLAGNITVAAGNFNRFQLAAGVSSGTFTLTGSNSFGADVTTGANITFRFSGTNAAGGNVWRPDATTSFVLLNGASFRSTIGNAIASYGMEASGTASVTGDVNASSASTIAITTAAGAQLSFAGVVRGGATYNKTGAGTWVVSSQFNDPITTNILEGTVQVPVFSALGGSSGASYLVLNGGSLRYTGAAASTAKQFTLGANGGSLDASGSGSAAFTSTAAVSFAGSGNRTLTLTGTNTGANTLAAALNDNGADKVSLAKTGAGTWVLSGSSTYSGGTDIAAGTLAVNGELAGLVNVGNGATLGGAGTLNGLVTVAAGGILAPGNSPGTLTMNSGLSLDAASILDFELNATNSTAGGGINDLVNVGGNLTLAGILNVAGIGDFSNAAEFTTWRLFSYTGTLINNGLTLGSMPSVGATGKYFQISTATTGQVNLVIVPEPGALALAGLGIGLAGWLALRRKEGRLQPASHTP